MGRRDKKYSKSLHTQAYEKLESMICFGKSKRLAKLNGEDTTSLIFSINTYKTYKQQVNQFIDYLNEHHSDVTTLDAAKKYIKEYLISREDKGDSAWTIQTAAKALGKLYGITPSSPEYYDPPKRHRKDIIRSRLDTVGDEHFSESNNQDLIKFCKATGLRRDELSHLKNDCLYTKAELVDELVGYAKNNYNVNTKQAIRINLIKDAKLFDEEYFIYAVGKGGRPRFVPVLKKYENFVIERIKDTKDGVKIFEHINTHADIHSYRGEYATAIYKKYARKIEDIPYDKIRGGINQKYQSEVYCARKDEKGKRLDKKAMLLASKALGHNRIEVVATNYIRGI